MNNTNHQIATELRTQAENLRLRPIPLLTIIPLLQKAADALDAHTVIFALPPGKVWVDAYKQCGRWMDDNPGIRAECREKFFSGRPCEKCPDGAKK